MLIPLAGNYSLQVVAAPDECPRCHHAMLPLTCMARVLTALPTAARDIIALAVFQCPRHECNELFIGRYKFHNLNRKDVTWGTLKDYRFALQSLEPRTPRANTFPDDVVVVSPQFARIYDQAATAEQLGLDEIAGPGYGKALEFLVKDYLIARLPADADAIRHEFLGTVIKNRIEDSRVKACAARAAWLRNDETHYERRWGEKDLGDLKTLLALTVNWVHSSILTDAFVEDMPDPQKREPEPGSA